jgi:competence protein ComEC
MRNIPIINNLCVSFALGIWIGAKVGFDLPSLLIMLMALFVITILWWRAWQIRLLALCILFLLLGLARYASTLPAIDQGHVAYYAGSDVMFTGILIEEPDRRDTYTNYRVSRVVLQEQEGKSMSDTKLVGTVLVQAERYPEYEYGDRLTIAGMLEEPQDFDSFSYKNYLVHQGIYVVMSRVHIVKVDAGHGSPLIAGLVHIKSTGERVINALLHEPESSLLAGLLFGVKRGFSEAFTGAMKTTGTSHIVAMSGYNITIIIVILQKFMQRLLPRKKQLPVFTLGITLFVLLVGGAASIVRAALMGWLVLLAAHVGRSARVTTSLLVASLVMLILNPHTLWDVGFQLSFLATGGLIWIYARVGQWQWVQRLQALGTSTPPEQSSRLKNILRGVWRYGQETLLMTLSAQLLVIPLLLITFGQLSIISPLVNVLVLFSIPAAMLTGAIAVGVGLFSHLVATPFVVLAWLPLKYVVLVITACARIPSAKLEFTRVSPLIGVIWYSLVGCWLLAGGKHFRVRSTSDDS